MSFPIPKVMKGVVIDKPGSVDVLGYKTDIPVPELKDGEVLIKNDFIGINFIDVNFRTGLYPAPKPQILGVEAEGIIVSVSPNGETYGLKPGDRVVWIGSGAYAEYSTCSATKVHVIPTELEPSIAAASLAQGLTALTFIQQAYRVKKGDWILVQGASGGVGLWLCQLMRDVGARVIGTASSAEKAKLATENGAEFTLNQKEDGIFARIMEITKGQGVAAIYDSAGAATFDIGLQALARDGTMVSIGNASGDVPPFSIARLSAKNLKVMKPSVFGYIQTREEFVAYSKELFDFIIKNKVDGMIQKVYQLADIRQAHTDLEDRKVAGKLLLKV
ncbi:hypothetical protein B0J14DRAFT_551078 [Halenospora varia]|nr:hypothetical protein B0J14DRAFT_551078 [Halenospora varia]